VAAGAFIQIHITGEQMRSRFFSRFSSSSINVIGSGNVVIVNGKVISGGDTVAASGPKTAEVRPLPSYSGIKLDAPAELFYTVNAASARLAVTTHENILPLLTTTVEDGQLVIRLEGCVSLHEPIQIEASGPSLLSLRVAGSGSMHVDGLTGESLRVKVSGSGDVDLSSLKAAGIDLSVSGSGNVDAHASNVATVDVSGSGKVRITGSPAQRDVDRSGSGQVSFR
jgi:hypothetical protein